MQTATSWGMDGFDIDWEPLTSTDYAGMLALVNDLRAAWPAAILAADLGWGLPTGATDNQFYVQLSNTLDQINLMTYGMADAWPGWVSWHGSAIFGEGADHPSSVNRYVTAMLNAGVPPAKLSMGIGFYGSCWNAPVTAPLQSPNGSHVVADDNTMSFAAVMNTYYSASAYRYDATAEAPYLSFPSATGPQGCTFISYENETSVAAKGSYARQKGLGGTIIWQINEGYNPSAADPQALLHAVASAFDSSQPAAPTSTAVASSSPTSTFGQSVTFTATVTSGSGVPTGTVTFKDGAVALGSGTLSGGKATLSVSTLAVRSHSITAVYAGTANFSASTSTAVTQVVNQAGTTTSVTSSRNPAKRRQTVTFTARVSAVAPGTGTPTGTVRFFDGGVQIGSASLSNGSAALSTSGLAAGSHTITAAYDGSVSYKASTSAALAQEMLALLRLADQEELGLRRRTSSGTAEGRTQRGS